MGLKADLFTLKLGPNDIPVIRLDRELQAEQLEALAAAAREAFGPGRGVILGPGASIETLTVDELRALLAQAEAR